MTTIFVIIIVCNIILVINSTIMLHIENMTKFSLTKMLRHLVLLRWFHRHDISL